MHRVHMALALSLAASAACTTDPGTGPRTGDLLRQLESCDAFQERLVEVTLESMFQTYAIIEADVAMDDSADMAAESAPTAGSSDAPTDFTTTNVQEEGVDEIDIVKTDGTHIYVAQDRGFHIVKSWPAEDAERIASLDLDGQADGLFLLEDTLVVVEHGYAYEHTEGDYAGDAETFGYSGTMKVHTIDVSDPAAPEIQRTITIQGSLVDARMVDGKIHLVTRQGINLPQDVWDALWNAQEASAAYQSWSRRPNNASREEAARADLRPAVEAALAGIDVTDALPKWRPNADADVESMAGCTDIYAPRDLSPFAMLTVATFDPEADTFAATGLMSDGWNVYASRENLYVAQSSQWWWGFESDGVSHIHKFALNDDGPAYAASGAVDGWLYDSFAMSEFEGHLRVATTDFIGDWTQNANRAANNVFILEDDDAGLLNQVGAVTGIAPGETIHAVRMMGERGYVVTFETTDPLFTLDLSDPTNPTIEGEFHMPGYSAYLHPVGDDWLLGVGMAGLETGELTGLEISLFDVSDMANPTRVYSHEVESSANSWSGSEALWNHHAITYHRDVLTIPAYIENWTGSGYTGFSGSISFEATTEEGIEEIGRVNHRDLISDSTCLYNDWYGWGEDICANDFWYANIRRSLYIEDRLYTLSDYGLKINDLNDPSTEIAEVLFYPAD